MHLIILYPTIQARFSFFVICQLHAYVKRPRPKAVIAHTWKKKKRTIECRIYTRALVNPCTRTRRDRYSRVRGASVSKMPLSSHKSAANTSLSRTWSSALPRAKLPLHTADFSSLKSKSTFFFRLFVLFVCVRVYVQWRACELSTSEKKSHVDDVQVTLLELSRFTGLLGACGLIMFREKVLIQLCAWW